MKHSEKVYIVKKARGAANTPEQMQSYQRLNSPTPGSKSYRELPKAKRQSILAARDKQQARGLARSNVATIPTTKGGLRNIPPRPAAHPLSKGVLDNPLDNNYLEADMDNTVGRMGQLLPILPYLKEGFPYLR